jgi:hypothetical protein
LGFLDQCFETGSGGYSYHGSTSEPSEEDEMRSGRSLLVITVGAILTFAVTRSPSWLNVNAVGEILIAYGVVGLVLGHRRRSRRRADVIQGPRMTTYIETPEAADGEHYDYNVTSPGR